MNLPFELGEEVIDDLTGNRVRVIGIKYADGRCGDPLIVSYDCWGIWVDNDYLDGARHPWELTKTRWIEKSRSLQELQKYLDETYPKFHFQAREGTNGIFIHVMFQNSIGFTSEETENKVFVDFRLERMLLDSHDTLHDYIERVAECAEKGIPTDP